MKNRFKINIKIFLLFIAAVAVIAVVFALKGGNAEKNAETAEDVAGYLASLGWEVELPPQSEKNVFIPSKFSEVYERYNTLQKKQGFDLSHYKGDTVKSYTFEVNNFPQASDSKVYANILAFDGRVIGGDLSSYAMDGFMMGLDGKTGVYD